MILKHFGCKQPNDYKLSPSLNNQLGLSNGYSLYSIN